MRPRIAVFLLAVLFLLPAGVSWSAIPTRKYDANGTIARLTPATAEEKKEGLLVTIVLKDKGGSFQVTKETALHRQVGKLVPVARPDDLKEGQEVSVWRKGKTDKAEAVLIFP